MTSSNKFKGCQVQKKNKKKTKNKTNSIVLLGAGNYQCGGTQRRVFQAGIKNVPKGLKRVYMSQKVDNFQR